MSPFERRIRSIPQRTMRDVWDEQKDRGIIIGSSGIGLGSVSRTEQSLVPREGAAERGWVARHVFKKPTGETPRASRIADEDEGRIREKLEIVENYNAKGDLGVILQFSGIDLGQGPFIKSRDDYGPDSAAFYSLVEYKGRNVFLILATIGDILETQVVPGKKDTNPFFREEILIPELLTVYNPASMAVCRNNKLVIVSYNPRVI